MLDDINDFGFANVKKKKRDFEDILKTVNKQKANNKMHLKS